MPMLLYDLCGRDQSLRFSPYCWRAKMALAHKGLAYDTAAVPFTEIAAVENGISKTVPVLKDGETVVSDSFSIAMYLDETYPEGEPLFGGQTELAAGRFIEAWTFAAIHPVLMRMIVKDIHDVLDDKDQAYFRPSREARVGKRLEEFQTGIEANAGDLASALQPIRKTLEWHAWLGGDEPRFVDYIPFGSLMWLKIVAGNLPLPVDDAVTSWFGRCQDLFGGLARSAPTARRA